MKNMEQRVFKGLSWYGVSLLCVALFTGCSDDKKNNDEPDAGAETTIDNYSQYPCSKVTCYDPPANECSEGNCLGVYNAVGWCAEGNCNYSLGRLECETGGCLDGKCLDFPCTGVTCNDPPESKCVDQTNLLIYNEVGYCTAPGGVPECRYASKTLACEGGCKDGVCVEAPNRYKTCNKAPARYCAGNELINFEPQGRIDDQGNCVYQRKPKTCSMGCSEGGCLGESACESVVCRDQPASFCQDAVTLRAFSSRGACLDGACIYAGMEIPCANGCQDGQCIGEPCAGVICDMPTGQYCMDTRNLVQWDGLSENACDQGVCAYTVTTTACESSCSNGLCTEDACKGVICNAPPADYCENETTAVNFPQQGLCNSGVCNYMGIPRLCTDGQVCLSGTCALPEVAVDTDNEPGIDAGPTTTGDTDTSTQQGGDTGTQQGGDTSTQQGGDTSTQQGGDTDTATDPGEPPLADCEGVLVFPDDNLEAAIREAIEKPTGDIVSADVASLTSLNTTDFPVQDLSGIQCLTGLSSLDLSTSRIDDIGPLVSNTGIDDGDTVKLGTYSGLCLEEQQHLNIAKLEDRGVSLSHGCNCSTHICHGGKCNYGSESITCSNCLLGQTGDHCETLPPCTGPITFADTKLEAVVRSALEIPTGEITASDMLNLTSLETNAQGIVNLNGLHCATNLTVLSLRSSRVTDLSPLKNLKKLEKLDALINQIIDLGPLSGLTSLTYLNAASNRITDLSPLSVLTNLAQLYLDSNQLVDISPLSGLTSLTNLQVSRNKITDLSPLVDNAGIANGDSVDIRYNALDCDDSDTLSDIDALKGRGVGVKYSCN